MSETKNPGDFERSSRPRAGANWSAIAPAPVPPPPTGVAGLPSILTLINDPAAEAAAIAKLRALDQAAAIGSRRGIIRAAAGIVGVALLAAGLYVGGRAYRDYRAGAGETSIAAPAPPPVIAPLPPRGDVATLPSAPAPSDPAPAPAQPRPTAPPSGASPTSPPLSSDVATALSPRPVATTHVQIEPGAAIGRPTLSEEWLRAHEALGLPPPRLVKTIRIEPPLAR